MAEKKFKFKHCEILNRALVVGDSYQGICPDVTALTLNDTCGQCTNEQEFLVADVVEMAQSCSSTPFCSSCESEGLHDSLTEICALANEVHFAPVLSAECNGAAQKCGLAAGKCLKEM